MRRHAKKKKHVMNTNNHSPVHPGGRQVWYACTRRQCKKKIGLGSGSGGECRGCGVVGRCGVVWVGRHAKSATQWYLWGRGKHNVRAGTRVGQKCHVQGIR